ncbi:protein adenylyltransferase SelO [Pseudoruegeria sp. SHC-113]|uniref:protein adenylyltransferase SelO n=1 Tax=Pseudoruegeria sp. SHC-113 TaxID=2855439 RepID=UPI0021BA66A0|nr:YdiU family protein [Pseudoruegeria sp. SHC-113]MCT8160868.1 YdiU family protein [Pseudoruegeria sp. SHC-113]
MTLTFAFDNSYATLPERFYTRLGPTPVRAPELIKVNHALARDLGLDPAALESPEGVAVLAGNAVPQGADPLAQAYAGHQFGGFSPQLGDGRALLLGEVQDKSGNRFDIQLKGSGPTPYSRRGDGRAWLGPVLREYLVSEAMHALGIPTTRALAAVTTGEPVFRETPLPGAVLTRVAASHIRVGTFQYFAARNDGEALRLLTDHVIARHYPDADGPLGLLKVVSAAQARLVAQWMGVGFIHGVMNTDNTQIAGETIDYGPCAFMDAYHPATVYSSIDRGGRYAYQNQPDILLWNLAQLATALVPIMGADGEAAVAEASEVLQGFGAQFRTEWLALFSGKIGLETAQEGDEALIVALLHAMSAGQADFTNTFRALGTTRARDHFLEPEAFDQWEADWHARLAQEGASPDSARARMESVNPAYIPRNHRIEQAIEAAVAGDYAPFERLNTVLATPFTEQPGAEGYARPPLQEEVVQATFCGT